MVDREGMTNTRIRLCADKDADVQVLTRTAPQKPSLYKVILLNDDYTPMEFVVMILEQIFGKSHEEATRIMLNIHHQGVGLCGVYPYDIAETKVGKVLHLAQEREYPLQCQMEKE